MATTKDTGKKTGTRNTGSTRSKGSSSSRSGGSTRSSSSRSTGSNSSRSGGSTRSSSSRNTSGNSSRSTASRSTRSSTADSRGRSSSGGRGRKKKGKDKQTLLELLLVGIVIVILAVYGNKMTGEQNGEATSGIERTTENEKSAASDTGKTGATPTGKSAKPTADATAKPTVAPTKAPTATPIPEPTAAPTKMPTATPEPTAAPTKAPTATAKPTAAPTKAPTAVPQPTAAPTPIPTDSSAGEYAVYSNTKYAWWFTRKTNHEPSGSGEEFDINQYGAYYRDKNASASDKVIYLTFDCGYELGYTDPILDTLAAHDAKAMFFVTKSFIKSNPELVIRMKEEGHMVGNHTTTHPSMPSRTVAQLKAEITQCAEYMYEKTGYEMDPFLRPPMGEYSERTLKLTQDLGYESIFWSIAYKDYDTDNQPGEQYVIDHFKAYHHNGAIPLIHNTSESNMEALDEVLTLLEEEGYRFGTLDELE